MAQSKVEICNVALGMLGAGPIRDFTEENKRARMCNAFYLPICDSLVARFDWPFARRIAKLQQVVTTEPVPTGWYPYQLPTDCLTPRDLFPEGSQDKWVIMGRLLLCQKSEDVYLRYTSRINESGTFPEPFSGYLLRLWQFSYACRLPRIKSCIKYSASSTRGRLTRPWKMKLISVTSIVKPIMIPTWNSL